MNMKTQIFATLSLLTLFAFSLFAQTPNSNILEAGVVNGKALSLPAPQFPAAAKAVGACGAAKVKVLIDESGNVESAEFAAGHVLLSSASVTAALRSKFRPTQLSGTPVKVSGYITYVFSCPVDEVKKNENVEPGADALTCGNCSQNGNSKLITRDGTKTISGGVVSGKAVSLPSPSYPVAAKAVRAGGAVSVQVLIDTEGNVEEANAASGHPLLRSASEQAARRAKFLPTFLEGIPVKVSGIITYVYNVPMSFIEVGYELAQLEKMVSTSSTFPSDRISSYFPQNWNEESGDIITIGRYLTSKEDVSAKATTKLEPKPEKGASDSEISSSDGNSKGVGTDTVARRIGAITKTGGVDRKIPDIDFSAFDQVSFSTQLRSKIRSRLTGDSKALWYFELGVILGNISADLDDSAARVIDAAELQTHMQSVPPEVANLLRESLERIVIAASSPAFSTYRSELITTIRSIKNSDDKLL